MDGYCLATSKRISSGSRELIGEDPDIDVVREMPATEAPVDDPFMDLMTEVLGMHDPTAMAVPCLVTSYTDATHWRKLGMKCYGFSPLKLPQGASYTQLLHGHDERIPIEGFRFGLKVLFEFVTRLVT